MRWTELPAASPVQDLRAWHEAESRRGRVARAALDEVAQRASAARVAPIVLLGDAAYQQAWRHVCASTLERGGLLAGIPVGTHPPNGPIALVHVTAAIAGVDDDATPLSLRLAGSVWSRANAALAGGEAIVGWFHSHPGIGAFFSDTDRRTQAAFFRQPYALGWVIDPLREEHAWFVGPQATAVADNEIVRA